MTAKDMRNWHNAGIIAMQTAALAALQAEECRDCEDDEEAEYWEERCAVWTDRLAEWLHMDSNHKLPMAEAYLDALEFVNTSKKSMMD